MPDQRADTPRLGPFCSRCGHEPHDDRDDPRCPEVVGVYGPDNVAEISYEPEYCGCVDVDALFVRMRQAEAAALDAEGRAADQPSVDEILSSDRWRMTLERVTTTAAKDFAQTMATWFIHEDGLDWDAWEMWVGTLSEIEREAAAEPAAAEPPDLDLERLAQAWHMTQRCVHGKGSGEPMQKPGYLQPDREVAADIIEEYERAAQPPRGSLPGPLSVQEADMCPNCVTPWKCNGPHLGGSLTATEPPDLRDAVAAWFSSHCPANWTEDEHLAQPTVNTTTAEEAAIAQAYVDGLGREPVQPAASIDVLDSRMLSDMKDRDAQTGPVKEWGSSYDHSRIQRSAYHWDNYELAAGDRHLLLKEVARLTAASRRDSSEEGT